MDYKELLEKYTDNDYIKKVEVSHLTHNGFTFLNSYIKFPRTSVELWMHRTSNEYIVRIANFDFVYLLKWPKNWDYFTYMVGISTNIDRMVKNLLNVVLPKNYRRNIFSKTYELK